MELAQLQFLRPMWLWALLAVPLLAWLWHWRSQRRNAWQQAVDAHLLPALLEGGAVRQRLPWLGLLALALALLAMAGPSFKHAPQPLWQNQAPLVIAVDLSEAMQAADVPPSRIAQARARIDHILRERTGGQVGLLAYAEDAYTVAPLTEDVANIALFLPALVPDVMPDYGAGLEHGDAGRAIVHAQRLLSRAGYSQGRILLLTAGADSRAASAARDAAAAGFTVSVLGIGSAEGARFTRLVGGDAYTRLDGESLQALASAGRGRYVSFASGGDDMQALGVLQSAASSGAATGDGSVRTALDQGAWLLPLVLVLVLLGFRRGAVFAGLGLVLLLPMAAPLSTAYAQAQTAPSEAAASLWRRADQQAHAAQRAGEAAYRRGDFAEAEAAFGQDDSARGQYNLGNALAKQGRYDEAIAAYDRALAQQPQMQDAITNRALVQRAQQQQPPQGGQQPQSQQPKPGQGNRQDGGAQDGQGQGSADSPSAPRQTPPPPSGSGQGQPQQPSEPSQPQSADAQQQAEADAAQREQMRRALEQGQSREQAEQAERPKREETAQERERRIINEAQLRRVADDPGGLLRAKFRLERQRRLQGSP